MIFYLTEKIATSGHFNPKISQNRVFQRPLCQKNSSVALTWFRRTKAKTIIELQKKYDVIEIITRDALFLGNETKIGFLILVPRKPKFSTGKMEWSMLGI